MNVLEAVDLLPFDDPGPCPVELEVYGRPVDNEDAWTFMGVAMAKLSGRLDDVADGDLMGLVEAFEYGAEQFGLGLFTNEQVAAETKTVFLAFVAYCEQQGWPVGRPGEF